MEAARFSLLASRVPVHTPNSLAHSLTHSLLLFVLMAINTKKKEGVQWSSVIVVVLALSVAVASGGLDVVVRNGGLKLRAWALLFSGEREEALQAWRWAYPLETRVEYPMRPIAEVNAEGESEGVSECVME